MSWAWSWVDETFSSYRPESQISRLGRGEPADGCDDEVRVVLARCDSLGAITGGYVDVRAAPASCQLV